MLAFGPHASAVSCKPASLLAACTLCLLLAPAAQGAPEQDLLGKSLQELLTVNVSGASKFDQPVSEAPASVSVVTAETIKLFGYRTLADILRAQRGMYVTDDRNYSYAGVRGFGRSGDFNSRLLVLLDGHRVNDNTYDSVYIGNDFVIDLDLVERVEIIRGPASSLYGNNAFFGVINIITRHGKGLNGLELASEAGHFEAYKGRISYGKRFENDLALTLSASYLDSVGNRSLHYPAFNDTAHNLDGERSGSIFANASWRDLSLQGAYVNRRKDIPTASYGVDFNVKPNFTNDSRSYANLKYEHAFPLDWTLQTRLYYDHYDYYGKGPYSGIVNRDESFNNSVGSDLQLSTLLADQHRIMGGASIQYNRVGFDNYDIDPYASNLKVRQTGTNWSGFLQDEYTILSGLILNAGLRYDQYESFGGEFSPRAALIYSPLKQTTFKLVYGEAFRAPNNYERYYTAAPLYLKGNPDLKPEKIQTYELIYEQLLFDHYKLTLSGYYNKIRDMIRVTPDLADPAVSTFANISSASVLGGESELEAKWDNGFSGRLSYAYQYAVDDQIDQRLVNAPLHLLKANLVVPLLDNRLFSGLELQYMSRRTTLTGHTSDHLIANLTLFSQKLLKGLECSFSLYNLFDQRFSDPASSDHQQDSIQQNGISWRFKVAYSF